MLKAKDIMTENVATIRGSATVAEAVKLMRLKELRALIVEARNEDDAYGIVTETDIVGKVVASGKNPKQVRVYEIMTKPCIVVNPDLSVEYVARLFAQTGIWRAPVIQGDLLGIVSVTDILTKSDFLDSPKVDYLKLEIENAIATAKSATASKGADSTESAEAWGLVEELEVELANLTGQKLETTAAEEFTKTERVLAGVN